jgi:two-component system, OmpR family, sensor histidine kinase CpxA
MRSRRKTITLRLGQRRDPSAGLARGLTPGALHSQSLLQTPQPLIMDILHDLKSPLARMTVALGLARQQVNPGAQEALDRIELEAERLNQMLQQLFDLAQVDAGRELLEPQEIDLLSLVKDVAADANFEALRADRTVQVLSFAPCRIHAVKTLLRSAIENVVRNALVHTSDATAVEISLMRRENGKTAHATVSVRDYGQGVPPSLLAQIFRPFFRVQDSPDPKLHGTGLGLAIAERAVRLHGGSITAANHPEGGLVVEIRLPAKTRLGSNLEFRPAAAARSIRV